MVKMEYEFLNFVNFNCFDKWYVEYYLNSSDMKTKYKTLFLKDIIKPISQGIKKEQYDNLTPIVEKIVFKTGEIVFRKEKKTSMNLYLCKIGELLISKINFHQGALSLNTHGNIVCTTHYQPYKIKTKKINPEYLVLVLRSQYFLSIVQGIKATGIKNESGYEFIGGFQIPVPPLSIQSKIVSSYNNMLKIAEKNQQEAYQLEESIDKILFSELAIEEVNQKSENNQNVLEVKNFTELFTWGVEYNIAPRTPKSLFVSKKFKNVLLNSVAMINPTADFSWKTSENKPATFLPMECISATYGEISHKFNGETIKSKGYTRFKDNDVLWAKITPCMQNGKCAIAEDLENGIGYGSTEYHIIRGDENKIINTYIYYFLRTQIIRNVAQYFFTGSAGQQRVGSDFLNNLIIPLPPIKSNNPNDITQESIVNKLFDIKQKIKANRQNALSLHEKAKKDFEEAIFGEESS